MSTTHITPTVGRIVWFYPEANGSSPAFAAPEEGEPLAAIVTRVIDAEAGAVHLSVFDAAGTPHARPYVQLLQEGQARPAGGRYATWMPYQVDQAKKRAAADQVTSEGMASSIISLACSGGSISRSIDHYDSLRMAIETPGVYGAEAVLDAAKAYRAYGAGEEVNQAPASTLPPHQQRVIDELGELDDRLLKLTTFFGTGTFAALATSEQQLLKRQEEVMQEYSAILGERVAGFACATAG